jgi:hypothetical protein
MCRDNERTAKSRVTAMLRFTIRDLLWLMALVAMGCAWWLERVDGKRARTSARIWDSRAEDVKGLLKLQGWESDWEDEYLGSIKPRNDAPAVPNSEAVKP